LAIDQVGKISPSLFTEPVKGPKANETGGPSFSETISSFIKDVDQLERDAAEAIEKLVTGEATDLHEVMVAVEKAGVSFDLLMEIRNKMLEAYREIMRMQV
jgi:flagellar hook-basal body complex protein FliE